MFLKKYRDYTTIKSSSTDARECEEVFVWNVNHRFKDKYESVKI